MIPEATIKRIKRLRAVEGLPWDEISERTGVPRTSAFCAVMGRTPLTKAEAQRMARIRKQAARIRTLKAKVKFLEEKIEQMRYTSTHTGCCIHKERQ